MGAPMLTRDQEELDGATLPPSLDLSEEPRFIRAARGKSMRVSVFGPGYVGAVSAACLAADGHRVVGIDVDTRKLDMIRNGKAPVLEDGIGELTARVVKSGNLTVSDRAISAVENTDVSLVCVGTPSASNGSLDTTYLERAAADIEKGLAARESGPKHTVVFRSTMLPESRLPHLAKLSVADVEGVVEHAEVRVVGKVDEAVLGALSRKLHQPAIDLVRLPDANCRRGKDGYVGIAW